ncbi:Ceramide kinase, putative [Pediculus humanus corporis]|uniref:Ceramide kinase, putative n=1 Tax=Pediculus humanus subsp. corporis TaxID=121224 RepID=E0W441_PEDHC|nr:Ceramide kinase, putative [Pediculus humanus corporis]EEB20397.1 Ceramide kinase, putative [Pediculus humanus corporis]
MISLKRWLTLKKKKSGSDTGHFNSSAFPDLPESPDYFHTSLIIHFVKHVSNNKWRLWSVTFHHTDGKEVSCWYNALESALNREDRPKNFLVFINPFCGKQKGVEIYNKTVKPILELAKVDATVIVTEHNMHCRDVILSKDIKKFDGVMAVGGDGTISEIINSLIIRMIRDENQNENEWNLDIPKVKIPVAIIPCGSTDCIAYSLNGTQDRKTAAIFAVSGFRCGLDVCSVYSQKGLCRYFLGLLAYGFLGDVLKKSEKHRWMGPKRYDYAGFLTALKNKKYYCEINMVLSHRAPGIGPKCYSGCEICEQTNRGGKMVVDSKSRYQEKNLSAIRNDLKINFNGECKGNVEKTVTVRGKYFVVGCANVSCACERSPNGFSPYSHVGDGSMDVLLIKPQSLFDIGRILLRSKSKTQALSDLSFIDTYKAKEMNLKVLDKNMEVVTSAKDGERYVGASVWNCDGELVFDSNIKVKNNSQLIQVFTRRISPNPSKNSSWCWNCYNCSKSNSKDLDKRTTTNIIIAT